MARNYGLERQTDYDELWQARRQRRNPWLYWPVIAAGLAIIAFKLLVR